jgi:hypothetical protein
MVMAACSSDDPSATGDNGQVVPPSETNGKLTLRIATHNDVTRADWVDDNATNDEMMNLWVVVLTDNSGNVLKSFACRPTAGSADQEIDEIAQIAKGTYKAYSFANISVANVCSLLGGLTEGAAVTLSSTPAELNISGTVSDAASKKATINGNGFDPTAPNNGYGEKGIPMSNVQTIAATDTEKDLIVIRMLAKVELQLFNETEAPVTIQSATLSDITTNATNNLMLLPRLTSGQDRMDAVHQDLQPNLNGTPATADYTYTPTTALTVPANYDYDTNKTTPAHKLTFYVNESATPASADHLFYLTLKLSTGEYRYALISNNAANEWNYIARNDYRVLPVVLDDYKFEIIPYDFPPIGVYPCSVKELDATENLYEMTFHDYGHFHLVPQVTKRSDNSTVPYGSTGGTSTYWTLDWDTSFKTAATKGGAWLTASEVGFYVSGSTATTDADDNGGVPVFDATTVWNGFTPFIFGKIAEPDAAWWANPTDKQIYHEMRVKLYVNGTYRRDMIYRFYMTLSADQLLSAPQLRFAPRRSHRP